jgi:2-polyprenyl-3-methyl-5-hydroxy-6-metoxy-1,4-benzoquinol methylase
MEKLGTKVKNIIRYKLFRHDSTLYRYYTQLSFFLNAITLADLKKRDLPRINLLQNKVLQTQEEWEEYVKIIKHLKLPLYKAFLPKNWDSLIALSVVLDEGDRNKSVLDAGGEFYSMILPWLSLFGFKDLVCINLSIARKTKFRGILYEPGDITKTHFENDRFDYITCLSVIEHGVDLDQFFKETNRILKKGGKLILSTDYFEKKIDTKGIVAFGVPVYVFDKNSILELIKKAKKNGLELTQDVNLSCTDKTVTWDPFDLKFTYITLTFAKN